MKHWLFAPLIPSASVFPVSVCHEILHHSRGHKATKESKCSLTQSYPLSLRVFVLQFDQTLLDQQDQAFPHREICVPLSMAEHFLRISSLIYYSSSVGHKIPCQKDGKHLKANSVLSSQTFCSKLVPP